MQMSITYGGREMVTHGFAMKRMLALTAAVALFLFAVVLQTSSAKTPDGMPPSEEEVCSGLQGAAFGLCNARRVQCCAGTSRV
jgi:hypothetical protein